MRIKCPNSDIVLELPGDRTDMKFTCPACHRVHRVTVTISTPGEDPPPPRAPSNTRSVTKAGPQMPKKYATGAYAPVVDIPIDANFVLLDGKHPAAQPGIDLGAVTEPPPPRFAGDLHSRQTEIITDRRDSERVRTEDKPAPTPDQAPAEPSPREAWRETVSDPTPGRADTEETTQDQDDPEPAPSPQATAAAPDPEPDAEMPPPPPPPAP
ncbi:MAG: hypothetical protein LUC93_17285, partial [Planctomycetaceae bacterium]|nr:hypothetical protein [Planctomycetaceae bacterium]